MSQIIKVSLNSLSVCTSFSDQVVSDGERFDSSRIAALAVSFESQWIHEGLAVNQSVSGAKKLKIFPPDSSVFKVGAVFDYLNNTTNGIILFICMYFYIFYYVASHNFILRSGR